MPYTYIDKDRAGSKQIVYLSVISGWKLVGSAFLKKRDKSRACYGFDLETYQKMSDTPVENWYPIWALKYNDDMGSEIYKPLQTGFPINRMGQFVSSKNIYKASFSFSPLVPNLPIGEALDTTVYTGVCPYKVEPITWNAEKQVYSMVRNIAYPILVQTTVSDSSVTGLGPLFPSSINFKVEEGGSVTVDVSLEGVKYFEFDENIETIADDGYVYRSANFIDCYCDFIGTTALWEPKDTTMVSMDLSIAQGYNIRVTSDPNMDTKGARFIELTNRTVTGTIKFVAKQPITDPTISTGLTMYFGGPFYFKMENIRWQRPMMSIDVGEGYLHTYKFIALANDNAVLESNPARDTGMCTEFTEAS